MTAALHSSPLAGRLLVVADRVRLGQSLQDRHPALEVATTPSYLSGIAELANGPVHAIVAYVEPGFGALNQAVRGLRAAAGKSVPLVLCCAPEAEPLTRKALPSGASNYVICPPDFRELDHLLRLSRRASGPTSDLPTSNIQEIQGLAGVLQAMETTPHNLLERLAELLTVALPTRNAALTADGVTGRYGPDMDQPTLREPILPDEQFSGEIVLGPSTAGAYSRSDIDKLHHYAAIAGHILRAAQRQHHWQQLAYTDDLTGLPNRRHLLDRLQHLVEQAARDRLRVTLCMFDIDDFKRHNDEFGYAAGDEIIRSTGQLFLRHCRSEDVVARYGGDEFVVVFWDAEGPRQAGSEHPDTAVAVMKRFQAALRTQKLTCLGPRARGELTISGGLATYPWDASSTRDLLRKAEQALREAKKHGKDFIHLIGSDPAEELAAPPAE